MTLDKSAILQIKSVSTAQNKKPCLRIQLNNNILDFHYDNCSDMYYGGCFAYTTNGVTVSASADCEHLITGRTLFYNTDQGFQLL
jgi:hypothetical protein